MRIFFLIALCCCLSACVTTVSLKPITSQAIQNTCWQESGVIGYRDTQQAFTASYIWNHAPATYQIHVLGPLGAWRAELQSTPHAVNLKISDGRQYQAKNVEQLMQTHLGWSIPISYLSYWLWGIPYPGAPKQAKYENGHLIELQQKNWLIHFVDYHQFGAYQIPSRIVLEHASTTITLVVNQFGEKNYSSSR